MRLITEYACKMVREKKDDSDSGTGRGTRLCSFRIAKANCYPLGDFAGKPNMRRSKRPPRHRSGIFLIVFLIAQCVAFLAGTALALSFDVAPVRAIGIGVTCWGMTVLSGIFLLLRREGK